MSVERGSDKHGPRLDDAMKAEVEGQVRSGHSTRAEEWHEPEPEGEDQRGTYSRGGPEPGAVEGLEPELVELRSELASHLDRRTFPADRAALERVLAEHHAPGPLVDAVHDRLPEGRSYHSVDEAVVAMRGA
ncbi:DUF2795 domain-containing protein [Yinghuangia sp. YIM S09857]|uniref:DUF2795 domain-containing protein n=1 Tax=Yinghuangia sp. YIM S09857 TaxID=3436929 RepID=UPI003F5325DE